MDLPIENYGLTEADLIKVFRYAPQETKVVRFLARDSEPKTWSLSTSEQWQEWLSKASMSSSPAFLGAISADGLFSIQQDLPSTQEDSGLVLILAQRAVGDTSSLSQEQADNQANGSLDEKNWSSSWPKGEKLSTAAKTMEQSPTPNESIKSPPKASRALRHVPFHQEIFREISRRFFVHGSISRAISRADVPLFSRFQVSMGMSTEDYGHPRNPKHDAIVYNCRSANTWSNDLALTVTHFTQSRLTFGILFGCTEEIGNEVLDRVSKAKDQSFHPILLPGIFAELERERMVEVVESSIDQIEEAIFEMNIGASSGRESSEPSGDDSYPGGPRAVRRTVWLNTTFLRNRLQIWKVQMSKMVEHVDEISAKVQADAHEEQYTASSSEDSRWSEKTFTDAESDLLRIGNLIKDRLRALIEEFEEKIEECTMRVDGMAMATQWSHGDTNMDIAHATGRDSSQMKSISLVTMVFLPGTFFATIFSMTFFNWQPDAGEVIVSGYIWIYVLVTVLFTVMALLAWWYFLVYRRDNAHRSLLSRFRKDMC